MTSNFIAPDVGALVDYGKANNGKDLGKYRVTGWCREAPKPSRTDTDIGSLIAEVLFEGAAPRDGGKRMCRCLREEATHVILAGIAGTVAPVTEVRVTGFVGWSKEQLDQMRERAVCLGRSRQMMF